MAFYMVYIQEAHPSDGWQLPSNEEDSVVFASPSTFEERASIAQQCVVDLGIEFPALIDGIDNAVDRAYTGWPERLYLIGADGRVAYKGLPGPFGFSPGSLEESLETLFPDLADSDEESDGDGDTPHEATSEAPTSAPSASDQQP